MPYNIDKNDENSTLVAQQVMQRIGHDKLKPNPAVYTVLFEHYNGTNQEISDQIELLAKEGKSLTTSQCEHLFETFLSISRERETFNESARRVQNVSSEIIELIRGAGIAHKEYNQQLQRQSESVANTSDLGEIKKIISVLVSDTKRMVEENQKLEEKLQDAGTELQQMRTNVRDLKQETLRDTLTGIANRKAFDAELKFRALDAVDRKKPLCLLMVDIDHFKTFNDTYGHPVGDQVLKLVARTLEEGLRPTDMVSRYGGEEFAVIIPDLKMRDAEKIAERMRERIAVKDIVNQSKNKKLGRLSISLGLAELHPGEPLTEFIDRSDRALYKAKAAGRNQVVMIEYDKTLHDNPVSQDIVIDS